MDRKEILNSPIDKFPLANPSIQDSFICDTSIKWIVLPINKPYVHAENRVWITFSTSHQVGWIQCILNIPDYKNI